jgi:hypothetical protein
MAQSPSGIKAKGKITTNGKTIYGEVNKISVTLCAKLAQGELAKIKSNKTIWLNGKVLNSR